MKGILILCVRKYYVRFVITGTLNWIKTSYIYTFTSTHLLQFELKLREKTEIAQLI